MDATGRASSSRRPTLADVAAGAGVSVALVSIVMRGVPGASDATRARVLQVAGELGYRPDARARLLRSSRTRLLGVVFTVEAAFHGDLVGSLYTAADEVGYELVLSAVTPRRDERRAVESLLDQRCDALVLLGPGQSTKDLAALAARLPVVAVARSVRSRAVDVVRSDDARGTSDAVDHLVGLGHTAIAHVHGQGAAGAAERRRGYREAMRRHGLERQYWCLPGGPTEDDGVAAVPDLLSRATTAVLAFNDRCATGVVEGLRRTGRQVPSDISVVGFDDSRLARLSYLDLTTVAQDVPRLAGLAITRAVDRLAGTPVAGREQVVAPRLVVRSTTAPPGRTAPGSRVPDA